MTTPAAIAQLAAEILGGAWAAETGPSAADGRLSAPGADTFAIHTDDYGHLYLEADLGGEITRLPRPTTGVEAEPTARAVAEAIRKHVSSDKDDGEPGASPYQRLNLDGHFSCADYSDPTMPFHPSITIAGKTCSFHVDEDGVAQISAELDSPTASGTRIWPAKAVPVRITLNKEVVFSTTGTWVIQFQHPDDGGDDGVWEYRIPAEEAPTEAHAHTLATDRLTAEIERHSNAEVWKGLTIRRSRFTA